MVYVCLSFYVALLGDEWEVRRYEKSEGYACFKEDTVCLNGCLWRMTIKLQPACLLFEIPKIKTRSRPNNSGVKTVLKTKTGVKCFSTSLICFTHIPSHSFTAHRQIWLQVKRTNGMLCKQSEYACLICFNLQINVVEWWNGWKCKNQVHVEGRVRCSGVTWVLDVLWMERGGHSEINGLPLLCLLLLALPILRRSENLGERMLLSPLTLSQIKCTVSCST